MVSYGIIVCRLGLRRGATSNGLLKLNDYPLFHLFLLRWFAHGGLYLCPFRASTVPGIFFPSPAVCMKAHLPWSCPCFRYFQVCWRKSCEPNHGRRIGAHFEPRPNLGSAPLHPMHLMLGQNMAKGGLKVTPRSCKNSRVSDKKIKKGCFLCQANES